MAAVLSVSSLHLTMFPTTPSKSKATAKHLSSPSKPADGSPKGLKGFFRMSSHSGTTKGKERERSSAPAGKFNASVGEGLGEGSSKGERKRVKSMLGPSTQPRPLISDSLRKRTHSTTPLPSFDRSPATSPTPISPPSSAFPNVPEPPHPCHRSTSPSPNAGRVSFITPSLSRASVSTPAIHLSSDPLDSSERINKPPHSIEALVSPPRPRTASREASNGAGIFRTPAPIPSLQAVANLESLDLPLNSSDEPSPTSQRRREKSAPAVTCSNILTNSATSGPRLPPSRPSFSLAFKPLPTYASSSPRTTAPSNPSISGPIAPGRQAIRLASTFLVKELSRPLNPALKALPAMGWEEVEIRLRALSRLEKTSRSMSGGSSSAAEERERRTFEQALKDGVVLCFLLNRLFLLTISPHLKPSFRTTEAAQDRNVSVFLDHLSTISLPTRHHFFHSDLLANPPTIEGLDRVANTLVELSKLSFDAPPPLSNERRTRSRQGSTSSQASDSSQSSQISRSRSPPVSPQATFHRSQATPPSSPPPLEAARARSPTGGRVLPGSPLSTAVEGQVSKVVDGGTLQKVRTLSNSGGRRTTPPSPLSRGAYSPRESLAPSSPTSTLKKRRPASRSSGSSGIVSSSSRPSLASEPLPDSSSSSESTNSIPSRPPISQHERERTPSLVGGDNSKRHSTDSRSSFELSDETHARSLSPGLLLPVVEIVGRERSCSPEVENVDIAQPTNIQPPLTKSLLARGKQYQDLGHSSQSLSPSTAGPRLPSILRPSSPSNGRSERPLGLRRVSPSTLTTITAGTSTDSPIPLVTTAPKRHVPRRGASIDLSRRSSSILSLPSMVEDDSTPDGLPHPRRSTLLYSPPLIARSSSPVPFSESMLPPSNLRRRNSAQTAEPIRRKSTKRELSPPPIKVPFPSIDLSGSVTDPARPKVPVSPLSQGSSRPPTRPSSPSQARPLASRTTKFVEDFQLDERAQDRELKKKMSATETRPSLMKQRAMSMTNDTRRRDFGDAGESSYASFSGKPIRESTTSMSISKPSAIRQQLVVQSDGKPAVTYTIGECIGKGQFGSVYRALELTSGKMVAIKRIKLEGMKEADIAKTMAEVDLLKRLTHPGIVKYEGMMRDEETLNIVLEYIENGSLGSTIKSFGKLNEKLVSSYVVKILEGIWYLHSQNVVHCDLKAANILTTKNGNVKLSDFGVSLNLLAVENKTENDVAGTPNWMAPEVIEMLGPSYASDIWSLGCTIIELLTGRPPFAEIHNGMSVMYRIVDGGPPPIPEGLSPQLHSFLAECFQKDPTMRPSAEVLFEHEWLRHELGFRELRPQDSIPFLRRVSGLQQPHPTLPFPKPTPTSSKRQSLPPMPRVPSVSDKRYSSPYQVLGGRSEVSLAARRSEECHGSQPLTIQLPNLRSSPTAPNHAWVKTSFGKIMTCKICTQPLKKSASMCECCLMICHASCTKFASASCNAAAASLLQSNQTAYENGGAFPFPIAGSFPNPTPLSRSSSQTNKLFGNWKRSKSPTPTVRRPSDDPLSNRWSFQLKDRNNSNGEASNTSRPVSRQSRVSYVGSSHHSESIAEDGSLQGSTSSMRRRLASLLPQQHQQSRDSLDNRALSIAPPIARVPTMAQSTETIPRPPSITPPTRRHQKRTSDCVVM